MGVQGVGRSEVGCRWRTPSPWAILWQTCREELPWGPAPLGTAGRVSLVPPAGNVTLSILAPPPPPNKHPLSFEGTAQGFLGGHVSE